MQPPQTKPKRASRTRGPLRLPRGTHISRRARLDELRPRSRTARDPAKAKKLTAPFRRQFLTAIDERRELARPITERRATRPVRDGDAAGAHAQRAARRRARAARLGDARLGSAGAGADDY